MATTIHDAVREVCLSFPEAEEFDSHGSPNFRVRKGRIFATYLVNCHGDGRVALWLNSPPGAQQAYVASAPKHFFVPPYVGPKGWVGVNLDQGLSWKKIAALVREAYENTAPPKLVAQIGRTIEIEPPAKKLPPEELDPLSAPAFKAVLERARKRFLALPQSNEDKQFGWPVWRAGKKTFASAYTEDGKLFLSFRVGVDQQGLYARDKRYRIPKYQGHLGWISLDVTKAQDWDEIDSLARQSYTHFATKKMLAQLS
jgi:predicted DNA-binding protein (MmcQ/YjbR family)